MVFQCVFVLQHLQDSPRNKGNELGLEQETQNVEYR